MDSLMFEILIIELLGLWLASSSLNTPGEHGKMSTGEKWLQTVKILIAGIVI